MQRFPEESTMLGNRGPIGTETGKPNMLSPEEGNGMRQVSQPNKEAPTSGRTVRKSPWTLTSLVDVAPIEETLDRIAADSVIYYQLDST